jgi:hypothetical protein
MYHCLNSNSTLLFFDQVFSKFDLFKVTIHWKPQWIRNSYQAQNFSEDEFQIKVIEFSI